MQKKLPKIYQSSFSHKVDNNNKVFYSFYQKQKNMENDPYSVNVESNHQEEKSVEKTLRELFQTTGYVFNIPVEIYNKRLLKSNILSLKKLIIALAGPLVNLILSIIFIVVHMNTNLIYTNILICIFNLIPIYPLDGGRIIKNALKIIFGNKKAIKLTNVISNVLMIILSMVSSVAILYYKNIAIFFIVIYLWIVTIIENKNYNLKNKIYKEIENYNNICKQKFSEDVAKIHN